MSEGAAIQLTEEGQAAPALAAGVSSSEFDPVVAAFTGSGLATAVTANGPTACFASGTRLASPDGGVAVEALAVGDLVLTAGGAARAIKWLGHRRIDCRRHPRPHDVWPVRIAPDAFGPGQPTCDLWLSPDHAVLIDGVLIPVRYLINDATIVQVARPEVTLLACGAATEHDLLLAEGLACESYLDTGNRGAFANCGDAVHMHPDFAIGVWQAAACAPLVRDGAELEAARSQSAPSGPGCWAMLDNEQGCGARDPLGRWDSAGCARRSPALRHRNVLPAGAIEVRLLSRHAVPAHVCDRNEDHRRLGVAVSRLWLDGQPLALRDARVGAGWHQHETAGCDREWRWTDGDAAIAVADSHVLEIEVVMTPKYWSQPPVQAAAAA